MSNIGRIIYGYCGGFFGESYDDKRIEAEGVDWIVARPLVENTRPKFTSFSDEDEKQELIEEWSKKEKKECD